MLLVIGTCGVVERGLAASRGTISKGEPPQTVDYEGTPRRLAECAQIGAGGRIVSVDTAVAEIAYQQATAEVPEIGRRDHLRPRCVQIALRHQPLLKIAI